MRRLITGAVVLSFIVPSAAYALSRPDPLRPAMSGGQVTASGFDKCEAPPSSLMRSWLGSPYRAVNIYFGGINRACADQPELSQQWMTTVTSNGWAVIPTYVGSQAGCTSSSKTHKISASTAAAQGTQEADDAAAQMAAIGLGPSLGNPVYFDMEPYAVDSSHTTCDKAVLTFLDAWSRELHVQGYVAGVYGTTRSVMKQLVSKQSDPTFQQPDDIWFADWNNNPSTTGETGIPDDLWVGHRIHQYAGGHNETYNGNTFNIDNDAVDGDVVTAVTPTPPTGPPYHYAAAPPSGTTLKERSTPETTPDNRTGVVYPTGADLSIECQTLGENIDGSTVWDLLSDGGYVADINTTTTGGLSFTTGIPTCDTTPPGATMGPLPVSVLRGHRTITWSGSDDASGAASYDVRVQSARWNSDLGGFHRVMTATTETSTTVSLEPGTRYCFEVRAIDGSGNVGAWSDEVCTTRALDDRSLAGGSAWKRLTGHRYYLHTATATHTGDVKLHLNGAHVSLIGVVATIGPGSGSVDVSVRGRLIGTVNLQSSTHAQHRTFMLPAFPPRVGKIRLTTKNDGALVRIDGLVVSGG